MRGRHPRPRTGLFLASGVAALVVGRASPAAADNCSVFTDCFNQANSASEAAFGLLLLAGLSLVLDFLPVIGTAKSGIEAVTGRDLVTGEALAEWEGLMAFRPRSDADVAGWADMVHTGQAWPGAVQFGGSRATNIVYWGRRDAVRHRGQGRQLVLRPAAVHRVEKGEVISQTHPRYPLDVANDMRSSSLADGRREVGDAIDRAYEAERVKYVSVRTGGRDELLAGRPTTAVEHVFLEPE